MYNLLTGERITSVTQCEGITENPLCRNIVYDGRRQCLHCRQSIALDLAIDEALTTIFDNLERSNR